MSKKPRRPTVPFVQEVVARSAPNPARPRLPEEFERQLEPCERVTASCYAGSEVLTQRTRELGDELSALVDDFDADVSVPPL